MGRWGGEEQNGGGIGGKCIGRGEQEVGGGEGQGVRSNVCRGVKLGMERKRGGMGMGAGGG